MLGVVVSHHLGVQVGNYHVRTTALGEGTVGTVTADSVVTVHHALAVLVETSHQVEGVVREESPTVEGLGDQVSDGLSGGSPLNLEVVDLQLGLEHLNRAKGTRVSSAKSAYMPEVARMVLSVSCTSLLSLRVIRL
jgi:hypothetical protein